MLSKLHQLPSAMQPQAIQNFNEFIAKAREILASSISEVFVIGIVIMSLALFASFFIKEIPLRKSHRPALEEGNFFAKNEPDIKGV